ncbi:hypothetical protein GLOIN_2v1843246 [Rhizophagus irregularis DAOM 181602=DAOM 197198]|uniref:Uncharacterized protein n=1 Tax=Rhizophagus irregularis (strain DAOM 181602 / DAOM 197198 / MUCL 43194) TaxID=747089 RepID=A0A2P4PRF5_RHIID|nr:hypothetical protein GLOIN_2v1843246 [Rhizophagus irregularis DAOM 181602=DAOM 197198]POG67957.1 hypothetical protein GLOIN_2v1843246 [Rhizophagus irregularis DAOM 181602=DAOM 197198]|eukprot:XP_025174823.1 hypothetical protein GLOIN_2v1843246 [Rhizophagus irregularis DAOM 181602=DAOM 197198]
MCESVLYRCEKQSIEDLKIFLNSLKTNWIKLLMNDNDQGEDTVNVGHSECYLKEVENVEDYYDYRQTYLKSLLNSVSKELIKEEAKLNAKAQSELEGRNILNENINLSNEMKLSDGQVYDINNIKDPIKRQGKGRPAGKRFKAYDEGKNKANSSKNQKENVYEIDIENMNDNSNNKVGVDVVYVIKLDIILLNILIKKVVKG